MKLKSRRFSPIWIVIFVLASQLVGQINQSQADASWIRIASESGDFSIEIPSHYKSYFNKDGFTDASVGSSTSYQFRNMRVINCIIKGALISVESYDAPKSALNALYDSDVYKKEDIGKSELSIDKIKIKQIVKTTSKYYLVRRYFVVGPAVYVLTAAAKTGETEEIKRFLNSAHFGTDVASLANATRLSKLAFTDTTVDLDLNLPPSGKLPNQPIDSNDPNALVILNKPKPIYTDEARTNNVQGTIYLNLTFADDGFISHIVVKSALPRGLLRQSLLAAMRIKYLSAHKGGIPVSVDQLMQYGFGIY
jgi:hypothetical protein